MGLKWYGTCVLLECHITNLHRSGLCPKLSLRPLPNSRNNSSRQPRNSVPHHHQQTDIDSSLGEDLHQNTEFTLRFAPNSQHLESQSLCPKDLSSWLGLVHLQEQVKIGSLLWERIVGVMLTTKKRLPSKYLLVGKIRV